MKLNFMNALTKEKVDDYIKGRHLKGVLMMTMSLMVSLLFSGFILEMLGLGFIQKVLNGLFNLPLALSLYICTLVLFFAGLVRTFCVRTSFFCSESEMMELAEMVIRDECGQVANNIIEAQKQGRRFLYPELNAMRELMKENEKSREIE